MASSFATTALAIISGATGQPGSAKSTLTNELIGVATSKWIIIDLNTRKICRSNVFTYPCYVREEGNYESFPKLEVNEDDLTNNYAYQVRNNDIDFIGHMNNTRYADMLLFNGVVKHFEINFIHEVKLNDILQVKHNFNKFVGYCDETVSFKAECTYF